MNVYQTEEVNLIPYLRKLWARRKFIVIFTSITLSLSLIGVLLSGKIFTSSTTFIPQVSQKAESGGLGNLASLAGINLSLGGASTEIPPSLYPKIVASIPFKKELIKSQIYLRSSSINITYQEYYEEYFEPSILSKIKRYTLGLPSLMITSLRPSTSSNEVVTSESSKISDKFQTISPREKEHFIRLDGQLGVNVNDEEGYVTLFFEMDDPLIAAQMTEHSVRLLQKYVIDFKIRKAQEELKYTSQIFAEKKKEFEDIKNRRAIYLDKNNNLTLQVAKNELLQLESDYDLALGVYNELAKQLEQAKLKVSKDTPVFSVIEPIVVPIKKSKPRTTITLAAFLFLGLLVSSMWVLLADPMRSFFKSLS